MVSDSYPDPIYWIQSLDLFEVDLKTLENGRDVTENIINASQTVLKMQFKVQGFQRISETQSSQCKSMSDASIQIHHTGIYIYIYIYNIIIIIIIYVFSGTSEYGTPWYTSWCSLFRGCPLFGGFDKIVFLHSIHVYN